MNILANKKFIIVLGVTLLLIILIYRVVSNRPTNIAISPTPSIPLAENTRIPTPRPTRVITIDPRTPQEGVEYYHVEPTQEQKLVNVGKLLEVMPHKGQYFEMEYNIDQNKYIVTIPLNTRVQGEQEFDEFLSKNGIPSRTWIHNLMVQYK